MPSTGLALPLLLAACGGDLSNAVFLDDADFTQALPRSDRFHLLYPGDRPYEAESCVDELADIYCHTRGTLSTLAGLVGEVTDTADQVGQLPPTERGENSRSWGPEPWDAWPLAYLLVEMDRTQTRSTYTYRFRASPDLDSWYTYVSGTHRAGEHAVAAGDGSFTWDIDAMGDATGYPLVRGLIEVEYDVRDLTWTDMRTSGVLLEQPSPDVHFTYQETDGGGGEVQFIGSADWVEGDAGDEDYGINTRWLATGEGRGDLWMSGGDIGPRRATWSECWAPDGTETWSQESPGLYFRPETDPSCPFADFEDTDIDPP